MASITHNPKFICSTYLGPEVDLNNTGRTKKPFSSKEAPAHVPPSLVYRDANDPKKYHQRKIEQLMLRPPVSEALIVSLEEDIKNHFEGRIASFWMQALLVYQTGLQILFSETADAQFGGAGSYRLVPEGFKVKKACAAAHMATLPTLVVQRANKIYAFGKGSFFHSHANATTWLPVQCNQVDSYLDRHAKRPGDSRTFRESTADLLKDLSLNQCSPMQGLERFLITSLGYLAPVSQDRIKEQVASCYREVAHSYLDKLWVNDYIFRALSGSLKDNGSIDEICIKVQSQMHRLFIQQMGPLQPRKRIIVLIKPQLRIGVNLGQMSALIDTFLRNNPIYLTDTVKKHISNSLKASSVRKIALVYLRGIAHLGALQQDLEKVIRTVPAGRKNLPTPLFNLYSEIKSSLKSNVHNMNTIVIRVLSGVSRNPVVG